jgi:hypothetical protein
MDLVFRECLLVHRSARAKAVACAPAIDFATKEQFSGLLLPLVRASLSDFGPFVSRFAEDLKRQASVAMR